MFLFKKRSYLTESILEGGASAWERANEPFLFEYMKKTENVKEDFNESMMSHTTIVMKKIFENYHGFESMRDCTLVDVGGGLGTSLSQALSKFPHLKCVNFDLPHVVSEAPQIHGKLLLCFFLLLLFTRKLVFTSLIMKIDIFKNISRCLIEDITLQIVYSRRHFIKQSWRSIVNTYYKTILVLHLTIMSLRKVPS